MTNIFSTVLYGFLLVILVWSCDSPASNLKNKPNFIIILADDLGYGGLGCYGDSSLNTPNIDALAQEGIRFTDFHSNAPVCSPTRAALLTGNYQQKAGLEGVIYVRGETRAVGLDTAQLTMAKLLKMNGYHTGLMGKWHLGYRKAFNPVHHGFDEFYGYLSGNIDFHSHYDNAGIYDWWHNLDSIQEDGYVTDLITDHSMEFISENKDNPFFLFVSHEAPHVPFQGRDTPAYRFPGKEFSYYGPVQDTVAVYNEMVEVMDEGVGKIMQALRDNELEENTLVFFISDNGAEVFGNNGALNGSKGKLLEGGQRVPGIAYWKGRIDPSESTETIMTMDLLPTILNLSKGTYAEELNFDGMDLSQHLLEKATLEERPLFWRYRNQKAVREMEWKLLMDEKDTLLFNLEDDLTETRNLADDQPEVLQDLLNKLEKWELDVGPRSKMKTI
ncbi:sulfatase-like hydrolase/transferase [Cyclobacterium plantarum]|uniref:sulfatase-like hydrolase/transferase n=1 Tax=Cyclobacterium plantarum TaxID=2716263 RepID=UPI003F70814D